jgi:hypothetical protein
MSTVLDVDEMRQQEFSRLDDKPVGTCIGTVQYNTVGQLRRILSLLVIDVQVLMAQRLSDLAAASRHLIPKVKKMPFYTDSRKLLEDMNVAEGYIQLAPALISNILPMLEGARYRY